jgi:hypothetical protein
MWKTTQKNATKLKIERKSQIKKVRREEQKPKESMKEWKERRGNMREEMEMVILTKN